MRSLSTFGVYHIKKLVFDTTQRGFLLYDQNRAIRKIEAAAPQLQTCLHWLHLDLPE